MYDSTNNSFTCSIFDCIGNNNLYHLENTYYIRYYSKKALFALNKLFANINISDLEETSFYYHIYSDMLLNAIGLLNDRFIIKDKYSAEMKENVIRNVKEYNFNDEIYPILNDKSFRNFIEHIFQRNDNLIKNNIYNGTFNFIHPKMSKKTINALLNDTKPQNNYINLIDNTYNIIDIESMTPRKKSISLDKLEKEIETINNHSNNIWDFINNQY